MTPTDLKNEAKLWLENGLQKEKLKNLTVKILENSGKRDGYTGDILFVRAFGISENQSAEEYNLVLKCTKKSESSDSQEFIQNIYLNEIYFYEEVLPAFSDFQKEKGVENVFDSVPKFFGKYADQSIVVIILQNLKEIDYDLWDKRNPVTRRHIDMVMSKYAEFHAISLAMQDQEPEKFQIIAKSIKLRAQKFQENSEIMSYMNKAMEWSIEEVYHVLKNDIEESVLLKWKTLKQQVKEILNFSETNCRVKVINHGDCWNNNFMYFYSDDEKIVPKKVAMLDWQLTKFSTPILDLSHFLFACISETDLKDLNNILKYYYTCLASHLEKLGSCSSKLYPFEEFMDDWRKFCKYGIMFSSLALKICSTNKDEVIDVAEFAKQVNHIKNKDIFKKRVRPVVEFAVKYDLI